MDYKPRKDSKPADHNKESKKNGARKPITKKRKYEEDTTLASIAAELGLTLESKSTMMNKIKKLVEQGRQVKQPESIEQAFQFSLDSMVEFAREMPAKDAVTLDCCDLSETIQVSLPTAMEEIAKIIKEKREAFRKEEQEIKDNYVHALRNLGVKTSECCICYSEQHHETIWETNCHHLICKDCVLRMLKVNDLEQIVIKCPLCRKFEIVPSTYEDTSGFSFDYPTTPTHYSGSVRSYPGPSGLYTTSPSYSPTSPSYSPTSPSYDN